MNEAVELEYLGFWARVVATFIDSILVAILTTPLLLLIYGRGYFLMEGLVQGPADVIVSYVLPVVLVLACWSIYGTTPGKAAFGAKIVDARTGAAPSMGQFVGRYLAYFLAYLPLCAGVIWVGIDRKKQGWHDMLAGTVVVRSKHRGPEPVRFE